MDKNLRGLESLMYTITNYSAITFAEEKLKSIKSVDADYGSYMVDVFGGKKELSIEDLEQVAFLQFLNEYKKCCEIYAGFISNGRVFVLDRHNRIVFFLYQKDDTAHKVMVHYNPFGVDLIEQSCPNGHFFNELERGRYDIGKNEQALVRECDMLTAKAIN